VGGWTLVVGHTPFFLSSFSPRLPFSSFFFVARVFFFFFQRGLTVLLISLAFLLIPPFILLFADARVLFGLVVEVAPSPL